MYRINVSKVDGEGVSIIFFETLPTGLFPFIDYSKYKIEFEKINIHG